MGKIGAPGGLPNIPGEGEGEGAEGAEGTESGEPAIKSTGEMDDDTYVEAMAYSMYFGQLIQAGDMVAAKKVENKIKNFYQESGVTGEKLNAYMEANPEKVVTLMSRVNQRVAELYKTGL